MGHPRPERYEISFLSLHATTYIEFQRCACIFVLATEGESQRKGERETERKKPKRKCSYRVSLGSQDPVFTQDFES